MFRGKVRASIYRMLPGVLVLQPRNGSQVVPFPTPAWRQSITSESERGRTPAIIETYKTLLKCVLQTLRMKCTFVLFLMAVAAFAADFTTGQAARLVIGQETFTAADPNSSNTVLGGASGSPMPERHLIRGGCQPHRRRSLESPCSPCSKVSATLPRPTDELQYTRKCPVCLGTATVVLGATGFHDRNGKHRPHAVANLRLPTAVASDGIHLVVADTNHNRLLIWNRIPNTNNAPADGL